jgi:hypothetical protein
VCIFVYTHIYYVDRQERRELEVDAPRASTTRVYHARLPRASTDRGSTTSPQNYLGVTADDLVALGPGGDMIGATDASRLNLALVVTAVACIASTKVKRSPANHLPLYPPPTEHP